MNGRVKRTQRITGRIKDTALQLFSTKGVENVSMEEIAQQADVSKVTIYNHFHSKDELLQEVLALYSDTVLTAVEEILTSDLDFLDKLRIILLAQVNRPSMASSDHLFELIERDAQAGGRLNDRLKRFLYRFFEQGKAEGYIEEDLPFELFYLHSEIYRAGYKAKRVEVESFAVDETTHDRMNQLFFWGILKRK